MPQKITGVRLPDSLTDKVKYIAWHDRTTLTALIAADLETRVLEWERTNKKITPAMIAQATKTKTPHA